MEHLPTRELIAIVERTVRAFAPPKKSCVYLISDGYYCKIGFTRDLNGRLKSLQSGNARPLRVVAVFPGDATDEARAHEKFAAYRVQGEWFDFNRVPAGA